MKGICPHFKPILLRAVLLLNCFLLFDFPFDGGLLLLLHKLLLLDLRLDLRLDFGWWLIDHRSQGFVILL